MSDDGNNPFGNYETTEHKMSGDNEVGSGDGYSGGGTGPQSTNDSTTPVWKVVVGLVWCVIFLVIAVSNNGRAGNPDNPGISFLASVVGVAGLILIPWGRDILERRVAKRDLDRAIGGFEDAVREQRLSGITEFIENNKGTELGEHIKIKFDQIDKTNVQQLNFVWNLTPDGKKEYEEWDEFKKSHR